LRPSQPVYVRFVCFRLIEKQKHRLGLFQALDDARESDFAPSWALQEIGRTYAWFKVNLAVPSHYRSGGVRSLGQRGLSWFKPAAKEHIAQMHALSSALSACGVHIEMLTTRDPGVVIFHDRFQVVAIPSRKRFG
jgi:hypothetical protein